VVSVLEKVTLSEYVPASASNTTASFLFTMSTSVATEVTAASAAVKVV
jgi:hypothetical protein